jgi:hypothetical protein
MTNKLTFVVLIFGLSSSFSWAGQIIYQETAQEDRFIPFGPDGSAGQPSPGNFLGNQITMGGTARFVDGVLVGFGAGSSTGTLTPQTDTYTLSFYLNNGAGGAPGTLIASSSVSSSDAGGVISLFFPFAVTVPDSFTAVVSSTHPLDTWNSDVGLVGPIATTAAPTVGSALNGLWFGDGSPSAWVFNSTWAMSEGASTNYFYLAISAVPEPCSLALMSVACGVIFAAAYGRRRLVPAQRTPSP